MNNEPIYEYKKGEGWVISFGPRLLTAEDCQGEWYKHPENDGYNTYLYPEICLGWDIVNSTHKLQPGDVVPWPQMSKIWLVTKIVKHLETRTEFVYKALYRGNTEFSMEETSFVGAGGFRGIARPR